MSVFDRSKIAALPPLTIDPAQVSDSAFEAIRMSFNPSGVTRVVVLKLLAAAFINECEKMKADRTEDRGREASVAITNMQTASMWAVLGATKGLP